MKTAIYIEDGVTQLVLTPETKYERDIVKGFGDKLDTVEVFNGSFYDCRGGWVRQSAYHRLHSGMWDADSDSSLILRLSTGDDGEAGRET
jgi:hypothetical protein